MKTITLYLTLLFTFLMPAVVAADADKVSPLVIPGATTVDVHQAKELFDQGVLFLDVRSDKDWNAGRVPDAEHLNVKTIFNEENLLKVVGKNEPMVIYCNGEKCLRSSKASKMAVEWGFTKVHFFRDGFPAWKLANNLVE